MGFSHTKISMEEAESNLAFGSTSIHGLQQAGRKGICGIGSTIWWCCVFVSAIAVMSYQIFQLKTQVMSYPKVVKTEDFGGSFTYPSITMCSLGLVKRSVVSAIPTIAAMESAMQMAATDESLTTPITAQTISNTIAPSTTATTTIASATPLACQKNCAYWEPFCYLNIGSTMYSLLRTTCLSVGGSMPTFPTTNQTTYNQWYKYWNVTFSTKWYWYWFDYSATFNSYNLTNGNWIDSYGRKFPSGFGTWQPGVASGSGLTGYGSIVFDRWGSNSSSDQFGMFLQQKPDHRLYLNCMCHCPLSYSPNREIVGDNFTDLTMSIQFKCEIGYRMFGLANVTCEHKVLGVDWTTPLPTCLMDCAEFVSQVFLATYMGNRSEMGNAWWSYATVTFKCPDNLTLLGTNTARCFNGTWEIDPYSFPLCADIPLLNESQLLNLIGYDDAGMKQNTLSIATALTGLMPYVLSRLTDAQMLRIGYNQSNMVVRSAVNNVDCDRSDIVSIPDPQNVMCQTFNHKNMSTLYVVDKAGETNGLRLLLFSLQDEYLTIVTSGGIKLYIHDQNDPIFFGHNGFMVSPGLTYSIALRKEREIRVNVPFGSCVDNANEVSFYAFHNTTYFHEACLSSYIQAQIVLNCKCSGPTLPIKDKSIPICGVEQYTCVQQLYNNPNISLIDTAKSHCPPACSFTYYQRTASTWILRPSEAAAKKLNISNYEYLANTIDLSIYFADLYTSTYEEVLSYTIINLMPDLGATMGVLAGMSVISCLEFFYGTVSTIVNLLKKKTNKQQRD